MFNFHKDHRSLIGTAFTGFTLLSIVIAVLPAYQMQGVKPLPGQLAFSDAELAGLSVYIAEGCVACHTQQVRSIEMDKIWGDRPSMPSDYYYSKQRMDFWRQSPSILGSERTGPDLTNVGNRQPGREWHLLHLYNPRSVVGESIMPAYPWLFEEKAASGIADEDVIVQVTKKSFDKRDKKVVAKPEALQLVAYLQSLRQTSLSPEVSTGFIPSVRKESHEQDNDEGAMLPDGEALYLNTCSACHQSDGKGVEGAFPSLAGSTVINDKDPEILIRIILQGYDARSEYGQMPGFADQLSDEEVAAIANHERTSWGNSAPAVSEEMVREIREWVAKETTE